MKNIRFILALCACLSTGLTAFSQNYKSPSDPIKLNKEWLSVSNDIARLSSELTVAQNKLPGYRSNASHAVSDAEKSAEKSSDQASKATNGDVRDARSAKRKARRALHDAKDASEAKGRASSQERKIDKLTLQLEKKQERLAQLEAMRSNIRSAQ